MRVFKLVRANLGLKAGALLLAVLLWLHAATEHTYQKEVEIALLAEEPSGEIGGLMWAEEPPARVRVRVAGGGKDLLRFVPEAYVLRLRLPDDLLKAGGGRYVLDPTMVEYRGLGTKRRDTRIEAVLDPQEISVRLDRRLERELQVKPQVELGIAESFVLVGGVEIAPEKVKVRGPEKIVRQMTEILTEPLSLSDLKEDVQRQVGLDLPPGSRLSIEPQEVNLSLDIQELAEYEIANVPVRVLNATGGVAPEPSRVKVRVRGGADIIGALTGSSDISLYVDYLEWSPGGRLEVRVETRGRFEVREISPRHITLFER